MTNIIDKAIDRVRGNWMQGELGDTTGNGPVCGVGAVCSVVWHGNLDVVVEDQAIRTMHDVAESECGRGGGFGYFNDHVAKSEEDVILMMKKASYAFDEKNAVAE